MIKFQSFLSSSSGNATFVTNDTASVLCDCGGNGRTIENCFTRLMFDPKNLDAIFITHEHSDHIAGAGIISRRYDVPIYASAGTWGKMEELIGKISNKNKKVISPDEDIFIKDMKIEAFGISHDAVQPLGYNFYSENTKFTIATDMGCVTDEIFEKISGCNFAIIEANHDIDMLKNGKYPFFLKKRILGETGHLSNDAAAELCVRLAKGGTKAFWLGHLSEHNNEQSLAYDIIKKALMAADEKTAELCVLPKFW